MPIGARIRSHFRRPPQELVASFARLAACDVADATGRHFVADPAIKAMGRSGPLVGTAVTVLCRPEDNLMIHAAIDLALPGDVIVVSAGGGTTTALVGEMVSRWARHRGVAGFIIDGAVRDVEALALPTYARGTNPRAPFKVAAGEVGYPVGIGGLTVSSGDIVVADADGVVVVPQDDAAAVLARARALAAHDVAARSAIDNGTYDRLWVGPALKAAGVEEAID